jgi:hypothetical protein
MHMGFFSTLFGSASSVYDQHERAITKEQIQQLVSRYKTRSLDAAEEQLIEETLIKRRKNDGKISLRQIDEVLRKLEGQYKISEYDRKGIIDIFQKYFF